jgi:hypothetical protein
MVKDGRVSEGDESDDDEKPSGLWTWGDRGMMVVNRAPHPCFGQAWGLFFLFHFFLGFFFGGVGRSRNGNIMQGVDWVRARLP